MFAFYTLMNSHYLTFILEHEWPKVQRLMMAQSQSDFEIANNCLLLNSRNSRLISILKIFLKYQIRWAAINPNSTIFAQKYQTVFVNQIRKTVSRKLSHSRFVTSANRNCCLYISSTKPSELLVTLVNYILRVLAPTHIIRHARLLQWWKRQISWMVKNTRNSRNFSGSSSENIWFTAD